MESLETVTPAEREYFSSKGEKPIPSADEAAPEVEEVEAPDPDDVEADDADEAEVEAKDEAPEPEQPKRKDSRIPLRKLQESENQRRELEKRLAEREEAFARADERLRTLMQLAQPKQEETAVAPPDPKDDPIGAIEWQKQQIERIEQERQRQTVEYQQAQQLNALDTSYRQSWSAFAGKQTDAIDAYNHFVAVTGQFLAMQGVPQERVNQLIENEERKIAAAALQQGRNPAELIYNAAKQMGYAPKQAAPAVDDSVRKASEADIERRQKASSASRSLGSASGQRSEGMPSAQELANMSEEEFAEFRSKVSDRQMRKLMGE